MTGAPATGLPLPFSMNVIDALRHHARMRPYDLAVVHPTGAANFLQLAGAVSQAASRLRSEGIEPGMTVAVYVQDPFVHLAMVLAAFLNGSVSVSAHPNFDPLPATVRPQAYLADRALPFTAEVRVIPVGPAWLGDNPADAAPLAGPGFADPHATCRIFTSSGTTGTPKAIAHTPTTLLSIASTSLMLDPLVRGPNLSMMAMATIGGFNTVQSTIWHGATLVLAPSALLVLRAINLHKVVALRVSPQQLQALVEIVRGRPVRFPSLEKIEVGGAATPASVLLAARATLCPNVVGIYGSTEAGLVAQAPAALMQAVPDAAGYVVPGASVRIVREDGTDAPAGEEGTVLVRTPSLASGYLGDPAATAAGFRDGWLAPGDLGVLRTDGVLRVTGRADEMINAGGVKLSPAMVDDFLLGQPGVKDAATFAYRQPGRSDQVWAAVVAGEGFDESALLAAAAVRLNSRAPVKLLRVGEIPRNAMGKALRQQLTREASPTA